MRCLNLQSLRPLLRNEAVKVGWRGKIAIKIKKRKKSVKKLGTIMNCTMRRKYTDVDDIFTKRGKGASE